MIQISVSTRKHAIVNTTVDEAFTLLRDVQGIAHLMPAVERTQTLDDRRYRCVLKRQSMFGLDFVGDYVCEYSGNGKDEIYWDSPEGNMRSRGSWKVEGDGGAVTLTLDVTTEVELPLPRILKGAVQLFAGHQASKGIDAQLERIRERLEAQVVPFETKVVQETTEA